MKTTRGATPGRFLHSCGSIRARYALQVLGFPLHLLLQQSPATPQGFPFGNLQAPLVQHTFRPVQAETALHAPLTQAAGVQVSNAVHSTQPVAVPPQPSSGVPHSWSRSAQVSARQSHCPAAQKLLANAVHSTQPVAVPPQPSPGVPHALPRSAQVCGTHAPWQVPFTHACPAGQLALLQQRAGVQQAVPTGGSPWPT
ncbi:hypothetical protein BH24CHL4_BH24CHL4_05470 [soil metagenome]